MKITNIITLFILILICVSIITIEGCTPYKNYLDRTYNYGKILEIKDKEIIVSIGYKERVRIGEIVDVYKIIKASPGFTRRYKKITMGLAEITEFVNEQNAKAKILFGLIDKDCRVDSSLQ
jgi:hypothetical protein